MRLLTLRTILAATDLDGSAGGALLSARQLATSAGATLHVVHVAGGRTDGGSAAPADGGAVEDGVGELLRRASIAEGDATVHVIPGDPPEVIRSLAERIAADVIVLGPHRARDEEARPLGGTARAVVEHASAPCLVAALPLGLPLRRVLVPIDLSDTARGALLVGLSWASALRAGAADERATTLEALHVDAGGAGAAGSAELAAVDREIEQVRQGAGDWAGVAVRGVVEQGADPAEVIARLARERDAGLVVLGTRESASRDEVGLGSVSASVLARLRLPILLVPPTVWRAHAAES